MGGDSPFPHLSKFDTVKIEEYLTPSFCERHMWKPLAILPHRRQLLLAKFSLCKMPLAPAAVVLLLFILSAVVAHVGDGVVRSVDGGAGNEAFCEAGVKGCEVWSSTFQITTME